MNLLKSNPKTILKKLVDEDQEMVTLMDIDPVERAMERILKYNLMVLPVVDDQMNLVGITSLNDLVFEFGYQRRLS